MAKKVVKTRASIFWKCVEVVKKIVVFSRFILSGIFTLLLLVMFASFFSTFFSVPTLKQGNIALIPIAGVITTTTDSQLVGGSMVRSDDVVTLLKDANKNEKIKGVILEIDSPGGSPVATFEIASQVKKMGKPVVSVIRETGASGGFWVATAAERVFANKMSVTGSIGVIGSQLELAGLLQRYNVTYRRLVAGKFKDAGSRYKEMSREEEALFQNVLDKLQDEFIHSVAQNRKLSVEHVRNLSHGFVFLGSEAKEYGLIDEFGGVDDALRYLEKKLNITGEIVEQRRKETIFEMLARVAQESSFLVGLGMGASVVNDQKMRITI